MKKNLFSEWSQGVLVACALSFLLVSCGGGGGGSDDDDVTTVAESGGGSFGGDNVAAVAENAGDISVSTTARGANGIRGSYVFINGRTVTIWATWCSDHEVTQAEYELHCNYGGSNQPNSFYGDGDNYPAYYVSWYDAINYCNKRSLAEHLTPCYTVNGVDFSENFTVPTDNDATWNAVECDFTANGYRLPTEAEWEYFARGGNLTNSGQTPYSGSDTIENVAWYWDNACYGLTTRDTNFGTHQVKTKAKNSLNLYDMSGNVGEWCWDRYGSISASTPSSGATSGSGRVYRGGGWDSDANYCSVAYRAEIGPNFRSENIGFRVVRTAD